MALHDIRRSRRGDLDIEGEDRSGFEGETFFAALGDDFLFGVDAEEIGGDPGAFGEAIEDEFFAGGRELEGVVAEKAAFERAGGGGVVFIEGRAFDIAFEEEEVSESDLGGETFDEAEGDSVRRAGAGGSEEGEEGEESERRKAARGGHPRAPRMACRIPAWCGYDSG